MRSTIWKVAHGKLLTNEERKRRGMVADDICLRCHSAVESMMHILRDCEEVQKFWSKHINQRVWSKFFSLGEHTWIDWNVSTVNVGLIPWSWSIFFGVAIWALWRDRNSMIFSQNSSMGEELWDLIFSQVHFIENTLANQMMS